MAEIETEEKDAKKKAPVLARAAAPEEMEFVEVEQQVVNPTLPLIPDARVVYLGAARNKNVPMVGRLFYDDEEQPDGTVKIVNKQPNEEGGISGYDFTTHDIKGRPIVSKQLKGKVPPDLVGKIFCVCEHPEHLRRFMRMKDGNGVREFRVLVPPQYRASFEHYVRAKDQAVGAAAQQLTDTVAQ